jgi:hypothetical protein
MYEAKPRVQLLILVLDNSLRLAPAAYHRDRTDTDVLLDSAIVFRLGDADGINPFHPSQRNALCLRGSLRLVVFFRIAPSLVKSAAVQRRVAPSLCVLVVSSEGRPSSPSERA